MKKDKKDTQKLSISATKKIALKRLKGKRLRAVIPALILTIFLMVPALYSSCLSGYMSQYAMENVNIDPDTITMDNFGETFQELTDTMLKALPEGSPLGHISTGLDLFTFLFSGAIIMSFAALGLRIIRNEKPKLGTAFFGLTHFFQSFFVKIWIWIFSFLITLAAFGLGSAAIAVGLSIDSPYAMVAAIAVCVLLLILYIYLITRFSMAYFIAADNKELKARHAIFTSFAMMKKRVWNFFFLDLSFIGWWILVSIPYSIAFATWFAADKIAVPELRYVSYALFALSIIFTSLLFLYQYSAEAVYYSTVSGNFKVNISDPDEEEAYIVEYNEELTPISEDEIPEIEYNDGNEESDPYDEVMLDDSMIINDLENSTEEGSYDEDAPAENILIEEEPSENVLPEEEPSENTSAE